MQETETLINIHPQRIRGIADNAEIIQDLLSKTVAGVNYILAVANIPEEHKKDFYLTLSLIDQNNRGIFDKASSIFETITGD